MPQKPNKIVHFWKELKRRRVVHVITVYASAAFVLIELVNNLTEPLNLPSNLATIVVIVLAVGFPLAIILAWIYDLTPEGMEKTKAAGETEGAEKSKVPNAWRIATYVSFGIIVGLLTLNIVGGTKGLKAGDIQSLVILPFDNFTGDDQLEYFVDGMHSSLVGDMGRIGGLRVIGNTSSRKYQNVDLSAPEIAEELEVDAVVEATVMCVGDSICLQVRVVSVFPEEKQLWIADYKEEKGQMLNLYNRITKQIADEVKVGLSPDEEHLFEERRTVDPAALDAYMKGQYYWELLDPDSIQKALAYYQLATELDPAWADPAAGLAMVWDMFSFFEALPKSTTLPMTTKYLERALKLDPNSAIAHFVNATSAVWTKLDWEKGQEEFIISLELNPNDALTRLYYAHLLTILRRPDEALHQANLGLNLDPDKQLVQFLYGEVLKWTGNYQAAIDYFEGVLQSDVNSFMTNDGLLFPYYATGNYEKWIRAWERKVKWSNEAKASVLSVFHAKGHLAAIEEMFRLNEKYAPGDCYMSAGIKMDRYLHLKEYEKTMDQMERAYEMRSLRIAYLATNPYYDQLKDHTRYIELLKKMNLPVPKSD